MLPNAVDVARTVASAAVTAASLFGSSKTKDTTKATTSRPPVAAGAPTPSRTQAGTMNLKDWLEHKMTVCPSSEPSPLNLLNQHKLQHYALIYENQQSFTNYLNEKSGNTTLNNPDDFDTHVDDFLLEKTLYESQSKNHKNLSRFSNIMKDIEIIDETSYYSVDKNIHPAGRIKTPFYTYVLSVEKQGIHNSNTDCWINAPLMSLRDIYRSLDEDGKKALLDKINSINKNSPLAAFLEGKYDATTPAAAQLLRLDVLRILNHYKSTITTSDRDLQKCINSINPEGKSTEQLDYGYMFSSLSKSLHIEDKVENKLLFCQKNTSNPLKLEHIVSMVYNTPPTADKLKDCYAFELNRSDDSRGVRPSAIVSIDGLTDNLKLHSTTYMPASIICHTTDGITNGISSGHFVNIFSRKNSDGADQWYATSDQKTEKIDLDSAMTKDNKKDNLSISFGAEDPYSSSGSPPEDKTTWKQFIALTAVHVTYVKDTAA